MQDEQDYQRAIQAYRFFYPTVSMEGTFQGTRDAGVEDNTGAMILVGGPRHVLFTGNSDTPNMGAVFNLKQTGPLVIELPAGPYLGIVNNHHFRWIHDIGLPGPDAGRGGKHVILPPDYTGAVPAGHYTSRANTYLLLVGVRALPASGDMQAALEAQRRVKLYPLAQSARPPAYTFVDRTEQKVDVTLLRWEDNLQYWEKLHKVLQEEPAVEEFRPMYGLLAALGIEQGKPFAPDARMQAILERAAKAGRAQMLVTGFASSRPDRGIGVFFRFGASDGVANPIKYAYNVEVGAKGLVPGRPCDNFGIGWACTELSGNFFPFLRQQLRLGLGHEDAVEMYYNAMITPWLSAALDLQIIDQALERTLNASGSQLQDLNTAVVLGLRV